MAEKRDTFILRKPVPGAINYLMASALATEMPDPEKLDAEELRVYTRRQVSKKGTDLNGNLIASEAESMAAAHETVRHFMTPQHVDEVLDRAIEQAGNPTTDTTIYVAVPGKPDHKVNVLAVGYATTLCHELNEHAKARGLTHLHFSDEKHIWMTSIVNRTFADAIGRLTRLPLFDTSDFKAGDKVILADDHVQSGGFFASAVNAFDDGVEILGVATLTRHPLGSTLGAHKEVKQALDALPQIDIVKSKLAEVGVGLETITDREALTIIAAMTAPDDAAARTRFDQLLDVVGRNAHIEQIEKRDDSLAALLDQPAMTARELVDAMERAIPAERKTVGAHG